MLPTFLMTSSFVLAHVMISLYAGAQDDTSTVQCKSKPVERGGVGALTCYFPFDVNTTRQQIILKRFNSPKYDEIAVGDWQADQEYPEWHLTHGYDFTVSKVGTNVSFFIQDVKPSHFGIYRCELIDTHPFQTDNCTISERHFEECKPCQSYNFHVIGVLSTFLTGFIILRIFDLDKKLIMFLLCKCRLLNDQGPAN